MAFTVKTAESLVVSLINTIQSSTTRLTDFNPGSVIRRIVEAFALTLEELYISIYQAFTESFEFVYIPFGFQRLSATRASGVVLFEASPPPLADIVIAVGTRVSSAEGVTFETTTEVTLGIGQSNVSASVRALLSGSGGNVNAQTVTTLVSAVPGVTSVNNLSAFTNGRELEAQEDRQRRFSLFAQSLPRATKTALAFGAQDADPTASVIASQTIDAQEVVAVIEDRGVGFTERSDEANTPFGDPFDGLPSPPTTDDAFYIGALEGFEFANIIVETVGSGYSGIWEFLSLQGPWVPLSPTSDSTNGLTQTGSVIFTPPTNWRATDVLDTVFSLGELDFFIRFRITSVSSPSLPRIQYITLSPGAGRVLVLAHDAAGALPSDIRDSILTVMPNFAAAGIQVIVRPPTILTIDMTATVVLAAGVDRTAMSNRIQTVIADYINSRAMGGDLLLSVISQQVLNIDPQAILDVKVTTLFVSGDPVSPISDVTVALLFIARSGAIAVSVIQ